MSSLDMYEETATPIMSDQFILDHHPLVKKIALYIKRRLPSHIGLEDLMQSGFVGLLEARKNYRDDMGTTFDTFAGIRIRGSIIDSLRKNSWGVRDAGRHARQLNEAITRLEQKGQKQATTDEIIEELGITHDEHAEMCQQISVNHVVSLDLIDSENEIFGDESANPFCITQMDNLQIQIKSVLKQLPEREQMVLSLYYLEEFTFKQIGEVLDLTEARVCQLHSQAISRVKVKMRVDVAS